MATTGAQEAVEHVGDHAGVDVNIDNADKFDSDSERLLAKMLEQYAASRQCLDIGDTLAQLKKEAAEMEERADRAEALTERLESQSYALDGLSLEEDEAEQVLLELQRSELEEENIALVAELEVLDAKDSELARVQEQYWVHVNTNAESVAYGEEQLESLRARTDLLIGCREALKQTNVLNDSFGIWYDGPFGTISGLRLGRLPTVQVEWSEVNAAWGQVALLLVTLARRVHFSFSKYRIIPQGSMSKMAKVGSENTTHELYVNTESYGGLYFKRSFNNALVCILHCMQELGDYAEKTDRAMRLPYLIEGDTIGGLSIRTSSSEVNWTRALKSFLINLKWLVAWSTKQQRTR